jgi:hypothetical protein
VALLLGVILCSAGARAQTTPSPSEELESAKSLYREGHFGEAIAKLQALLDRIPLLRDVALRRMALADAYLHLALSYVALDERDAARQALRGMREADPERTLSPDVYAPKVRALYAEVQAESRQAAAPEPAPTVQKRRSRTAVLVGGGAILAGGGAVLATRGGGTGAGAEPPGSSPTTSAGNARIQWLGATPGPGSSIPLRLTGCPRGFSGACSTSLNMVFSVTSEEDVSNVFLKVELLNGSIPCLQGTTFDGFNTPNLRSGVPAQMIIATLSANTACAAPFDVTSLTAYLYGAGGGTLASQGFGARFRFTP